MRLWLLALICLAGAARADEAPLNDGKYDDLPVAYQASVNTQEVPCDRNLGQKPRLDNGDIDALTAFLKTLTDKGME